MLSLSIDLILQMGLKLFSGFQNAKASPPVGMLTFGKIKIDFYDFLLFEGVH